MGITSNDIAAQRAMLARGEEKRKAVRQAEERERLRDTFAAAALTGLLADDGDRIDHAMPDFTSRAYEWADAMLRERARYNAEAVVPEWSKGDMAGCSPVESDASYLPCPRRGDTGVAAGSNPADSTHDDAATGEPGGGVGFSPGSSGGKINRSPERQSPDRERGESPLRDVPQLDNSRAAGGPEHHISETEIDSLEFVVEEGRIANIHDYGILRSLLIRLRQEWEFRDSPEPIKIDLSQPCMVDPPSGWKWGFPRRYDPASDGPMKEWLVRNGYPKHLADKGLTCTFTLCGNEEAEK